VAKRSKAKSTAGHCQIGVEALLLRQGSVLVAHPRNHLREHPNSVVLVTESTPNSTMGLLLNKPSGATLQELMRQKNVDWPWPTPVYAGGDVNPTALVMLHTTEFSSSNTMYVGNNLAISSDNLMLEKLEMGAHPHWYRMFLGCMGWMPIDLAQEIKRSNAPWLMLDTPSLKLIQSAENKTWRRAIDECSQNTFADYF